MGWQPINQQDNEYDRLMMELSRHIHCAVRCPPYEKPIFECTHNVAFMILSVKGAVETDDWKDIIQKHVTEVQAQWRASKGHKD